MKISPCTRSWVILSSMFAFQSTKLSPLHPLHPFIPLLLLWGLTADLHIFLLHQKSCKLVGHLQVKFLVVGHIMDVQGKLVSAWHKNPVSRRKGILRPFLCTAEHFGLNRNCEVRNCSLLQDCKERKIGSLKAHLERVCEGIFEVKFHETRADPQQQGAHIVLTILPQGPVCLHAEHAS